MRELTVDELTAVVGGSLPTDNDGLPGEEGSDQRDQLLGDFYSYGYAEMSFGFFEDVGKVLKAFGNWLSGEESRQTFMQSCAAQGKTAVFTAASEGFELETDPANHKIKLKASTNTGSRFCR